MKKQTICWDLIPNQYEYKILLVLSNERYDIICNKLNKHHDLGYKEGREFQRNEPHPGPCTIVNPEKRICVILLERFENSVYDQCTLAHELFHVVTTISNNVGLKINDETTEAWAYFQSFYLKVCLECLLEHLEEIKQKQNCKNKKK
jgi:hypothetical protein